MTSIFKRYRRIFCFINGMHIEIDSLIFFVFLIADVATPTLMVTDIARIKSTVFYYYFIFIL